MTSLASGDHILRDWVVKDVLGQGGFGAVYRMEHAVTRRSAAVKCTLELDAKAQREFLGELEGWLALPEHPHLVRCWFARAVGTRVVIASDFVDGGSLDAYARRHPLSAAEVVDVFIQAAWGLGAAHEAGFVHQDFKPQNLLVNPGQRTMVNDFGLARARDQQGLASHAGAMTMAYCSPEQAAGQPLTPASDQWSWGASLLHHVLGECVWEMGFVANETLDQVLLAPDEFGVAKLPRPVLEVLSRALTLEPTARFATLDAAAEALIAAYPLFGNGEYPRSRPSVTRREAPSRGTRWRRADQVLLEVGALLPSLRSASPEPPNVPPPLLMQTPRDRVAAETRRADASPVAQPTVPLPSQASSMRVPAPTVAITSVPGSATAPSFRPASSLAAADLRVLDQVHTEVRSQMATGPAGLDVMLAEIDVDRGEAYRQLADVRSMSVCFEETVTLLNEHPLRGSTRLTVLEARALIGLGHAKLADFKPYPAAQHFDRVIGLIEHRLADVPSWIYAEASCGRGEASLDLDLASDAQTHFSRALAAAERANEERVELVSRAYVGLARSFMRDEDWTSVREIASQAMDRLAPLTSGEATFDYRAVASRLGLSERLQIAELLLARAQAEIELGDLVGAGDSLEKCEAAAGHDVHTARLRVRAAFARARTSGRDELQKQLLEACETFGVLAVESGREDDLVEWSRLLLDAASLSMRRIDDAAGAVHIEKAVSLLRYLRSVDRSDTILLLLWEASLMAYVSARSSATRTMRGAALRTLRGLAEELIEQGFDQGRAAMSELRTLRLLTWLGLA